MNKFYAGYNGKDTKSCSKAEELKSKKVESLSPKLASLSSESKLKKKCPRLYTWRRAMCVQPEENKKAITRQDGKEKCKDEEEELTDREMQ